MMFVNEAMLFRGKIFLKRLRKSPATRNLNEKENNGDYAHFTKVHQSTSLSSAKNTCHLSSSSVFVKYKLKYPTPLLPSIPESSPQRRSLQ